MLEYELKSLIDHYSYTLMQIVFITLYFYSFISMQSKRAGYVINIKTLYLKVIWCKNYYNRSKL